MDEGTARALRESEDRYRSVVSAMPEGVVLQDASSAILACNKAAEQLLGLTTDQLMGRTSLDPRWRTIHEDGSAFPGDTHPVPVSLRTGQPQRNVVMGVYKPDGTLTWIAINSEPLFREGERHPYAAVGTFSDISHHKTAEDALRQSEERYRRILDTTLEGVWMIDLDGRTTFANQRMAEILGCTIDELMAANVLAFVDASDRAVVAERMAARARGIGELHDFRFRRQDGTFVWTSMATSPITLSDGSTGALAMVRDITDARRMEDELRESKARLELALSAGQLGTWEWNPETGVMTASSQVHEILGLARTETLERRDAYVARIHPEDRDAYVTKMQRYLASEAAGRFFIEYRLVRPDGAIRYVHSSGRAIRSTNGAPRVIGTIADVTESRMLEAELQQARQLESVGRLAGGVAHDFNNLLTAILASVQFAEAARAPGIAEELQTIRAAAERGAELTGQLLAFARKQVIELAPLDLNAIVSGLAKVLRRLVGEDIELSCVLAPDLWLLRGGQSQLEQVIVNLVVNAREAMPDGGPLRIETRNVVVAPEPAVEHRGVPAGEYVCVAVTDQGRGIDAAVLPHIFEPFYSTKRAGTGLGLASSYGIVDQLGGHIRVHSERGVGSTFTVYLRRERDAARPVPAAGGVAPVPRSSSTVLLVEDDDLLRGVVVRGLVEVGYDVLVASDGEQALAIAAAHPGPIHALITDVIMPRMSGRQLAERFGAVRPEAKILFVSGYTDQIIARQGVLEPGQHFLAKPYTLSALSERVDELLRAPGR